MGLGTGTGAFQPVESHLARAGNGVVSEAGGSGSSKCLGQTMGTVCGGGGAGGAGWGGVGGTVAPQQECDRLSGNVNVSPHCSLLLRGGLSPWLHAHPAAHGLEPPMGMAWRGARRWVIPESPFPASLSNLLGLGRMMGQGYRASLCHGFAGDLRQVPVSLQASVSPSV